MVVITSNHFLVSALERSMDFQEAKFWEFSSVLVSITHMAATRRSVWGAALTSVLRFLVCPSSLEFLGDSRGLVFSSVMN